MTTERLVERQRDPSDARAVPLTPAEGGSAEAERLVRMTEEFGEALSALAPEDLAAMLTGARAA